MYFPMPFSQSARIRLRQVVRQVVPSRADEGEGREEGKGGGQEGGSSDDEGRAVNISYLIRWTPSRECDAHGGRGGMRRQAYTGGRARGEADEVGARGAATDGDAGAARNRQCEGGVGNREFGLLHVIHKKPVAVERHRDYALLDVEGAERGGGGTLVALATHIEAADGKKGESFYEGDFRFWVDESVGERVHETGTEDMFNAAHGYSTLYNFSQPLYGAPYIQHPHPSRSGHKWHMYRLFLGDAIRFVSSIRGRLEHGSVQNEFYSYRSSEAEGSYGHTAFIYRHATLPSHCPTRPESSLTACSSSCRDLRTVEGQRGGGRAEGVAEGGGGRCCLGGLLVLDSVDVGCAFSEAAHSYQLSMAPGVVGEESAGSARVRSTSCGKFCGERNKKEVGSAGDVDRSRSGGGDREDGQILPETVLFGGDQRLAGRNRAEGSLEMDEPQEWRLWKVLPWVGQQGAKEKGAPERAAGSSASATSAERVGTGQKEETREHCRLGLKWLVQRYAVRGNGSSGEEGASQGAGALRSCASGLCDDAEQLSFRAVPQRRCVALQPGEGVAEDTERLVKKDGEEAQVLQAMGVGMVGKFEQPGPVVISFLVNVSRSENSCSHDYQGYWILRRDLDFSVANQCARVYVAGSYSGMDLVTIFCVSALSSICLHACLPACQRMHLGAFRRTEPKLQAQVSYYQCLLLSSCGYRK